MKLNQEQVEKKKREKAVQKAKEEELLKNDANKLQEKIKELNSEIEDKKMKVRKIERIIRKC